FGQVSLRERRYRPVVVCGHFAGQAESERVGAMEIRRVRIGATYRRLFQKITRLDPIPFTARMWRAVEREGAALVHIHNEPKLLAGLRNELARTSLPVVVHVANEKPIDAQGIPRVARWVAVSRYIAQWLQRANGIA